MSEPPPIFIVGMPRSGTSLLRELINNSPEISLPPVESSFIPSIWFNYQDRQNSLNLKTLQSIYEDIEKTNYWFLMKKEKGLTFKFEEFINMASIGCSLDKAIGSVLEFFAYQLKPESKGWGDKSPNYRTHLPVLNSIFPGSKFIHIIRDPRDTVLSIQRAWGKSMIRAAHIWNRDIQQTRQDGMRLGKGQYLEVRYEELVTNPEEVLAGVYSNIGIDFSRDFLQINSNFEKLGDSKNFTEINRDNIDKYKKRLSRSQQELILAISQPARIIYGIKVEPEVDHRKANKVLLYLLKYYDGVMSLAFHIREKGLFTGFRYFWNLQSTRVNYPVS